MKFKVHVGQRYNQLVVMEKLRSLGGHVYWKCQCDCGQICETRSQSLLSGHRKSCGCLQHTAVVAANLKHGFTVPSHPKGAIYNSWRAMKRRCLSRKSPKYHSYGGRGIGIEDPRWLNFEAFKADMEGDWRPGLSIERKDNNRGYCKDNCIWATPKEQAQNRRPRLP